MNPHPLVPDPIPSLPLAGAERPGSARVVLVASAAATLLLYNLPYVGRILARPLILLSTLAHEMGHGLTAALLGGDFLRLEMWMNGAGLAEMDLAGFGRIRQGLSIVGGLVGPAVAAAICFALGRTGRGARACLWGLGALLLIAELLVVRNLFGFAFVGVVLAACLLAASRLSPHGAQIAVVFVGVQLALSVFSRADYLFTQGATNPTGSYPSDVMQMQQLLFLPYWFWGVACGGTALAVLLAGLWMFWRREAS
ncbi:MAG TPA: M50 family metallopeptidase [Thermoanaerobaculia bacterium]|nr:M50 family metallopeptidase [Thermoanaerobaculia bacterium]